MTTTNTTNYGLLQRRGDVESTYNYQSTDGDLDVIDNLMDQAVTHVHSGLAKMADPTTGPTLVASLTGGALLGGTTYEYVISWLDNTGESKMSSAVTQATAAQLVAPGAPTITRTANPGTLSAGSYFYKLTVYDSAGSETEAGTFGALELTAGSGEILVTFPSAPASAIGWKIYRMINSGTYYYLGTGLIATTTYTDTGAVTPDYGISAPTTNTTNSTNTINVSIAALSIPAGAVTWRAYRRINGEDWSASNLVATTAIGTTNIDDIGAALLAGVPRQASSCYGQPSKVDLTAEVTGALPPANIEASCLSFFLAGTLLDGTTYAQTTLPYEITPIQIDAYWLGAPAGTDATHYVSVTITDDIPITISLDNKTNANLVTYLQAATPVILSAGVITIAVDVTDAATPLITDNGNDVNLVIWY